MTTLDFARTTRPVRPGVALVQLHEELWRVTRPDGEVLGYIERSREQHGFRYGAKRLLGRQLRFLPIGEFWSLDDAIDCFGF
jgi:hypothetical protein